MEKNISFQKSILGNTFKNYDVSKWEKANKQFEKEQYKESFFSVLNYLSPDITTKYSNADKTEFTIPHGSTVVIISLKEDVVSIRAPFVKIPEQKFLPIFRKCTELNFSVMTLPQIFIENDYLVFTYSMPLALCEPYKLNDLLRDICINADKYDDEFISKFGATRVLEPMVTNYSDSQLDSILKTCKEIAQESLSYFSYFEGKRQMSFCCDTVYMGMRRIEYYCNPTGMLSNKLEDALRALNNREYDWLAKLKPAKEFFASFETMTTAEFKEYCYRTFSMVPLTRTMSRNALEEWIEDFYSETQDLFNSNDFVGAAFYAQFAFYTLLCNFNMDESIKNPIEFTLQKAANKSWEEACEIYLELMEFFYQNEEDTEFDMDEDTAENNSAEFDMNDLTKQLGGMMGNYQSLLSNFLKPFSK